MKLLSDLIAENIKDKWEFAHPSYFGIVDYIYDYIQRNSLNDTIEMFYTIYKLGYF